MPTACGGGTHAVVAADCGPLPAPAGERRLAEPEAPSGSEGLLPGELPLVVLPGSRVYSLAERDVISRAAWPADADAAIRTRVWQREKCPVDWRAAEFAKKLQFRALILLDLSVAAPICARSCAFLRRF